MPLDFGFSTRRGFFSNKNANVSILFAFVMFPLTMAIGSVIDTSAASSKKERLQAAADSALLAGVVAAKGELDRGNSQSAAFAKAQSTTATLMDSSFGSNKPTISSSFSVSGLTVSGSLSASLSQPGYFKAITKSGDLAVKASSQAQASLDPYIDIFLLVDISASMLLPATDAGITKMRNGTGCALACHDRTDGNDTYGYALRNGVTMRFQVVNQGIDNLLTYIKSKQAISNRVRVELWSFDHDIRKLVPLTSDMSRVSTNFPSPAVAVDEESAATNFNSFINTFVSAVGTSGVGATQADSKKLVMIATDGVNDPTRAWTWQTALRSQVKVFDTAFCDTLKSRGNTVSIINTPYLPMTWDWGYVATLGQPGQLGGATRVDDIPIALRKCAGSNFTIASDVQAIRSAFVSMYTAAVPVRLSR